MSKNINFFKNKITETWPGKKGILTEFIFYLKEKLHLSDVSIYVDDYSLSKDEEDSINQFITLKKQEVPLDYILEKSSFYGNNFFVDPRVLIPRPETESLVAWILETADTTAPLQIIDIGTGTGCIPITLAKHLPKANLFAIEVSKEALRIAKQNTTLNKVKIHFTEKNILETTVLPQKFDVIVSNPPYVRALEKVDIKKNVLENEPHLALFVEDDNPLLFYDKIADIAKEHLTINGLLFFEINQYLGTETVEMLHKKGFKNIELRKDLFGKDRMIQCSFFESESKD